MQTTVEEQARHTIRLVVEVPPEEFARDLDRAYRKVAGQVRIPGFRKGKAPRQVIDAMVGKDVVLEEFVHDSVPAYYVKAIDEHELVPIAEPEIDVDDVHEGQPFRFTATVEVRPRVELDPAVYQGLRVDAPSAEPSAADVEEYVEHLRERFAELEPVSRPARAGDYVLADVRGHVHDTEVVNRPGDLIEVGGEGLMPEFSTELDGARAGDILKFNGLAPEGSGEYTGKEVAFQVLVKEVKAKRLPAADDGFATTASEFDTIDELRADIRRRIRRLKESEAKAIVRDRVLTELVQRVDVELPDSLVDRETDRHVRDLERRVERAGISMEQALDAQGWDELRFRSDSRAHAIRDLKAELALEAIARQEGLSATEEELDREIQALAKATKRDPKQVRRILERSGEIASVTGDIIRAKALDLVVDRADVISKDVSATPDEADPSTTDASDAAEPALPQSGGTG